MQESLEGGTAGVRTSGGRPLKREHPHRSFPSSPSTPERVGSMQKASSTPLDRWILGLPSLAAQDSGQAAPSLLGIRGSYETGD